MSNETHAEQLYLVLGCYGRIDDGFVSCSSCENKLLLVHPGLENYNAMMDYFETCRLFDKPAFEFNAIRHILENMQQRFDQLSVGRRLWSEKEIGLFQKFIMNHRTCGLYLKLKLVQPDELELPQIEEKLIKVEASSKITKTKPKVNLRLVRGKR